MYGYVYVLIFTDPRELLGIFNNIILLPFVAYLKSLVTIKHIFLPTWIAGPLSEWCSSWETRPWWWFRPGWDPSSRRSCPRGRGSFGWTIGKCCPSARGWNRWPEWSRKINKILVFFKNKDEKDAFMSFRLPCQAVLPDCNCQFVLELVFFSSYWQLSQSAAHLSSLKELDNPSNRRTDGLSFLHHSRLSGPAKMNLSSDN